VHVENVLDTDIVYCAAQESRSASSATSPTTFHAGAFRLLGQRAAIGDMISCCKGQGDRMDAQTGARNTGDWTRE